MSVFLFTGWISGTRSLPRRSGMPGPQVPCGVCPWGWVCPGDGGGAYPRGGYPPLPLLLTPSGNHHTYSLQAVDTHPTGMLSCWWFITVTLVVAWWLFAPKFWEVAGTYESLFCSKMNAASVVVTCEVVGTLNHNKKQWASQMTDWCGGGDKSND